MKTEKALRYAVAGGNIYTLPSEMLASGGFHVKSALSFLVSGNFLRTELFPVF